MPREEKKKWHTQLGAKDKKKIHLQYTCTEPKYPYPTLLKCIPPSILKSSSILTNNPTET